MSPSKSKCSYSDSCLQSFKRAVPFAGESMTKKNVFIALTTNHFFQTVSSQNFLAANFISMKTSIKTKQKELNQFLLQPRVVKTHAMRNGSSRNNGHNFKAPRHPV